MHDVPSAFHWSGPGTLESQGTQVVRGLHASLETLCANKADMFRLAKLTLRFCQSKFLLAKSCMLGGPHSTCILVRIIVCTTMLISPCVKSCCAVRMVEFGLLALMSYFKFACVWRANVARLMTLCSSTFGTQRRVTDCFLCRCGGKRMHIWGLE